MDALTAAYDAGEQMLDAAALRELLAENSGPVTKREGVVHLRAVMGLAERPIVNADRKMIRYRSSRPSDTKLCTHPRDLANERKRAALFCASPGRLRSKTKS